MWEQRGRDREKKKKVKKSVACHPKQSEPKGTRHSESWNVATAHAEGVQGWECCRSSSEREKEAGKQVKGMQRPQSFNLFVRDVMK